MARKKDERPTYYYQKRRALFVADVCTRMFVFKHEPLLPVYGWTIEFCESLETLMPWNGKREFQPIYPFIELLDLTHNPVAMRSARALSTQEERHHYSHLPEMLDVMPEERTECFNEIMAAFTRVGIVEWWQEFARSFKR